MCQHNIITQYAAKLYIHLFAPDIHYQLKASDIIFPGKCNHPDLNGAYQGEGL